MPRDSNGVYTLVSGINPVIPGTVIAAAWANPTLEDVAAALTDSLSRTGQGGIAGQLLIADGTAPLPGLAFTNEPSSGLFRSSPGVWELVALGVPLIRLNGNTGDVSVWNGEEWIDDNSPTIPFYSWYQREIIDVAGVGSWDPADFPLTTLVDVTMTGGGAGGAGSNGGSGADYVMSGSGGGGGGTIWFSKTVGAGMDITSAITYVVGAGGGGGSGNTDGNDGVDSSWDTTIISQKGNGGKSRAIPNGLWDELNAASGGNGGQVSNPPADSTVSFGGQGGQLFLWVNATGTKGRAGGGGGGITPWDGGSRGSGDQLGGADGSDAGNWGGGGGGAHSGSNDATSRKGGNGHDGVLIVDHFRTLLGG